MSRLKRKLTEKVRERARRSAEKQPMVKKTISKGGRRQVSNPQSWDVSEIALVWALWVLLLEVGRACVEGLCSLSPWVWTGPSSLPF